MWEPSHINERIPVQSSVFLFGEEPFKWKEEAITIEIAQSSKKDILEKLDKFYGLNENYFFPDFYGFAKSNRTNVPSKWLENYKKAIFANKPEEKIALYDKVISENRSFCYAFLNRGNEKYNNKDYPGAIADYTECIRLKPAYTDVYLNRGNAYVENKNYDEAIADYTQCISIDSNDFTPYYKRGLVHLIKRNNVNGRDDLNKAKNIISQKLEFFEHLSQIPQSVLLALAKKVTVTNKNTCKKSGLKTILIEIKDSIEADLRKLDELDAGDSEKK